MYFKGSGVWLLNTGAVYYRNESNFEENNQLHVLNDNIPPNQQLFN